jgi:type VI secretion system (T6SS) FHA protein/FHA domain-containing protein
LRTAGRAALVVAEGRGYSFRVGTVFLLRATTFSGASICERRVWSLPIRIGRNALNDFPLIHERVAEFHALIEDSGGKLCVRDINSQHGVWVRFAPHAPPSRIPPQQLVDLAACGFQFLVGGAALVSLGFEQASDTAPRPATRVGSVLGNQQLLRGPGGTVMLPRVQAAVRPTPTRPLRRSSLPPTISMDAYDERSSTAPPPYAPPPVAPAAYTPPAAPARYAPPPVAPAAYTPLPAAPAAYGPPPVAPAAYTPPPAAPAGYGPPPVAPPPYLPPPEEMRPVYSPPTTPPPYSPASTSSDPALTAEGRTPVHTAHFALPLESLALEAVRELAASLVPQRNLETTGDLARFVTKLHDLTEVFCRCFVPLREGHQQFICSLDLQRAAEQRGRNASPTSLAVETAKSPEALALALLDYREQALDAPKAVEGIFADLMIHQVALLDGVMRGVRALLDELSPAAIEQGVGPQGAFGLDLGNARGKALWAAYSERYANLAEDEDAMMRIFGPEFTEVYRGYRNRER